MRMAYAWTWLSQYNRLQAFKTVKRGFTNVYSRIVWLNVVKPRRLSVVYLIAGPHTACGYDTAGPPGGGCAQTSQRQTFMLARVQQHRYVNIGPLLVSVGTLRSLARVKIVCIASLSHRGLTTCGQFPYSLSRTSLITSVSPDLWVNLSRHHDNHGVLSGCRGLWLILVFMCSLRSQRDVSCTSDGDSSSFSEYHFLVESSCFWDRRHWVPAPHFPSVVVFFWWDYCILFLEIFIQNYIVSMSPCVSIKASLLAVITGIHFFFLVVCLWKCLWTLNLITLRLLNMTL